MVLRVNLFSEYWSFLWYKMWCIVRVKKNRIVKKIVKLRVFRYYRVLVILIMSRVSEG